MPEDNVIRDEQKSLHFPEVKYLYAITIDHQTVIVGCQTYEELVELTEWVDANHSV